MLFALPRKVGLVHTQEYFNSAWVMLWKLRYGPLVNRSTALNLTSDGSKLYCSKDPKDGSVLIAEIYRDRVYDRFFEPKDGFTVVDVGAHVGIYTVKAANKVGKRGCVISVEPDPYNYRLLIENVKMNNLNKNVIPLNIALGNLKGKAKLYLGERGKCHSLLPISKRFIEVEVNTLDNVMQRLDLRHCDILKIDVEGYELEVLKGAQETLKNTSMVAVAAYHSTHEAGIVQEFLISKGFKTLCSKPHPDKAWYTFVYAWSKARTIR
jgi:FkbM family methyltransferase